MGKRSGRLGKLLLLGISAISIPCLVVSCTTNQPTPVKQQPTASPEIWINLEKPFSFFEFGPSVYLKIELAFANKPTTVQCLNNNVQLECYKGNGYMNVKIQRIKPGTTTVAQYYMDVFTYNPKTQTYYLPFKLNGKQTNLTGYSQVFYKGTLTNLLQSGKQVKYTGIIYITNPNP